MNSWLMDVSLSSDNLKTQTIYCWVNKKCKIGFPEEFPEDGGTWHIRVADSEMQQNTGYLPGALQCKVKGIINSLKS